VWTAFITMFVSRRRCLIAVNEMGSDGKPYAHLRWLKVVVERATRFFDFLLNYMDIENGFVKILVVHESPAINTNVGRWRILEDVLAFLNRTQMLIFANWPFVLHLLSSGGGNIR